VCGRIPTFQKPGDDDVVDVGMDEKIDILCMHMRVVCVCLSVV